MCAAIMHDNHNNMESRNKTDFLDLNISCSVHFQYLEHRDVIGWIRDHLNVMFCGPLSSYRVACVGYDTANLGRMSYGFTEALVTIIGHVLQETRYARYGVAIKYYIFTCMVKY